jgi:hypothetical protein
MSVKLQGFPTPYRTRLAKINCSCLVLYPSFTLATTSIVPGMSSLRIFAIVKNQYWSAKPFKSGYKILYTSGTPKVPFDLSWGGFNVISC